MGDEYFKKLNFNVRQPPEGLACDSVQVLDLLEDACEGLLADIEA